MILGQNVATRCIKKGKNFKKLKKKCQQWVKFYLKIISELFQGEETGNIA